MLVPLMGVAQEKKKEWVPPKRPKLIKWEPPVQEDPELIDEWRPYFVSDNWMLDFTIGGCQSLAENMAGQQLKDVMLPLWQAGGMRQRQRYIGKPCAGQWPLFIQCVRALRRRDV